jgi:CdiI immunity protein
MTNLDALRLFCEAYLHQDWEDEYPSVWDALAAFATDEGEKTAAALADDVKNVIQRQLSEEDLRALLVDDWGMGYWPPGDSLSFAEWLLQVQSRSGPGATA